MGSKAKIAKDIVPIIQGYIDRNNITTYFEAFVGGCNVIDKVRADIRIASDKNEYLIALFEYLQCGGELPESVTREEYNRVRSDKSEFPAWYVGAVGFLASYNGRFFDGGYAGIGHEKGRIRDYYQESRNNLINQIKAGGIHGIDFRTGDYEKYEPKNCLVYCDPPYMGTKEYGNARQFDYLKFWKVMEKWSKDNIVIISELEAPEGFTCIWEKEVDRSMKAKEHFRATEKLFILGGKTA
jgi:Site-specific DNA methylase